MLYHDKETVSIAEVVRYVVTYDPAVDTTIRHGILHHVVSSSHVPSRLHPMLHLRIRNTASVLLRPAYLQGPYALAVSVREDTFHANDETIPLEPSSTPVHNQDLKASTSFWVELASEKKYVP